MKRKGGYKLVALDLDNTLLNPDSVISEYAVRVLRAIEKTGVRVTFCTGRPYPGVLFYIRQVGLDSPGVFCNGAQIRDGRQVLEECPLPIEDTKLAVRLGEENGAHPRVYINDRLYVSRVIEEDRLYAEGTRTIVEEAGDLRAFLDGLNGRRPLKLINVTSPEALPALFEKSEKFFGNRLYVTQSMTTFLEYMNPAANKGQGLKKLAARLGVRKEEIVAAGDHFNDLTMFAEAGYSIAPKNAQPDVLDAASCVCLPNTEDGVPKKLAEIFL
ncbi:MAG: Cof-type HAD-IIB family hydrolase [Synergistaceae bacterium]|jgi:Cof subfamily protein (haloacid dehalogenase superfamily)|nr:Cof-type HAD-IIB family hydrolase [Synergistaceae bacterium]